MLTITLDGVAVSETLTIHHHPASARCRLLLSTFSHAGQLWAMLGNSGQWTEAEYTADDTQRVGRLIQIGRCGAAGDVGDVGVKIRIPQSI